LNKSIHRSAVTLRQIEYFIETVTTGQVSKAALRCNVSQSSLTIALRNLEAALDATLFVRHSKGVRLTERGERFLRHAMRINDDLGQAIADMNAQPDEVRGTVRMGVTETFSAYLVPALSVSVARRYPNLVLEIIEADRATIEHMLLTSELEVALVLVSNLTMREGISCETLLRSPRHLWTEPGHPLQRAERVTLQDVALEPYVLLDMDEHVATVSKYWGKHGLTPMERFRSTSIEAVRSLVALGQGVTILSDFVYRPWSLEGSRIARRALRDEVPTMDVGAAWAQHTRLSAGAETLLRYLRLTLQANEDAP